MYHHCLLRINLYWMSGIHRHPERRPPGESEGGRTVVKGIPGGDKTRRY